MPTAFSKSPPHPHGVGREQLECLKSLEGPEGVEGPFRFETAAAIHEMREENAEFKKVPNLRKCRISSARLGFQQLRAARTFGSKLSQGNGKVARGRHVAWRMSPSRSDSPQACERSSGSALWGMPDGCRDIRSGVGRKPIRPHLDLKVFFEELNAVRKAGADDECAHAENLNNFLEIGKSAHQIDASQAEAEHEQGD